MSVDTTVIAPNNWGPANRNLNRLHWQDVGSIIRNLYTSTNDAITLPWRITEEFSNAFETYYLTPATIKIGTDHTHPGLAIDRNIVETQCYLYCRQYISNTGWIGNYKGSAARDHKYKRNNIWAIQAGSSYSFESNSCKHNIISCKCRDFDTYIFIHTIDQINTDQIFTLLLGSKTGKILVSMYIFSECYGEIGEAMYIADDEKYSFSIEGSEKYTGFNHVWIPAGGISVGQETCRRGFIRTRLVTKSRYSSIYILELEKNIIPSNDNVFTTQSIVESLKDDFHLGNVYFSQQDYTCNIVPITSITSYFKNLVVTQPDQIKIAVPKSLVSTLATYVACRTRVASTYLSLTNKAKHEINKYKFIPHSLVPFVVVVATHLAFTYTLGLEVSLRQQMLTDQDLNLELSHELFRHNQITQNRLSKVAQALTTMSRCLTEFFVIASAKGIGIYQNEVKIWNSFVQSFKSIKTHTQYLDYYEQQTVHRIEEIRSYDDIEYCVEQINLVSYVISALPCVNTKLIPQLDNIDISANYKCYDYADVVDPKGVVVALGIVVQSHPPVVHASTFTNEFVSAVNRGMPQRLELNERTAKDFKNQCYTLARDIIANHPIVIEPNFEDWVSRYPLNKQQRLRAVRNDRPFSNKQFFKSFVKREKLMLATPYEIQEKDPRMIQGCTDEYNVIVGPTIYNLQTECFDYFNVENRIFIAAAVTSEQIGEWFERHADYLWSFESDFSRFDSSIHQELLHDEISIYQTLGAPRHVVNMMRQNVKSWSRTIHGFNFYIEGTRKSGCPNTTFGNSLINIVTHLMILQDNDIRDYYMIVLGDDILVLIYDNKPTINTNLYGKLGFKATYKYLSVEEKHNIEFCSHYFYPAIGGTVFSPKIGRTMCRFGWFIDPIFQGREAEQMVLGVAISHMYDFNHIPILRCVTRKIIEIYGAMSAVPDNEHRIKATEIHDLSDEIYEVLRLQYGILKHEIDEIENTINSVTKLPASINHPALAALIECDM